MATAEAGDRREPPGLGPRTRRSTATSNMAGGGGEGKKGEPEGPQLYVLSLPAAALPLPIAVSRLDGAVPRKARSCRTRANPSGWWSFRLPLPPPDVAKEPPQETRLPVLPPEEASPQGPQRLRGRMRVPPAVDDVDAPVMEKEKPAKRARRCLQCGSAETPQWRSGPMGRATLCNACGVRLRAAGALRDPEHGPPPATVTELPPGSPDSDSPPDSPIWEPQAQPREEVYLVRKPSKRRRKEAIIPPAPSIYLVKKQPSKKKKTPKKQPWRPRKTAKRCLHCGSSSTPQWRHGPMGRSTLCNACGVRYRQGRLLPEYRPAASPTFTPSEHANRHREVIQLRRQRQDKSHHHHHPPPPPQPVADDLVNVLVRRNKDPYPPTPLHQPLPQPMDDSLAAGKHNSAANVLPGCGDDLIHGVPSSLDSLLLDGPSAPLIVDGDEFVIS